MPASTAAAHPAEEDMPGFEKPDPAMQDPEKDADAG
ncbi:MAG: Uncharacterised protein [SAR116 cluster bacterium]|nr:MAG: Uncharacterised protein [SAR116 cluster bacterium]